MRIKNLGLMATLTLAAVGCASQSDQADGPARRVLPSHGWRKPGVSPKEVYEARQACGRALDADQTYQALMVEARKMPASYKDRTKEQEKIDNAPFRYEGHFLTSCLKNQGFVYGKIKPEEVYVPPPPKWDWVKEGVSHDETMMKVMKCLQIDDRAEFERKCMTEQGFKWEIIDAHPASRL